MNAPKTLNELFLGAVDRFSSKRAALQFKSEGGWHDISHHELARRVKHTALGLYELGVRPGDIVVVQGQGEVMSGLDMLQVTAERIYVRPGEVQ